MVNSLVRRQPIVLCGHGSCRRIVPKRETERFHGYDICYQCLGKKVD
jgi:hypothetical protein